MMDSFKTDNEAIEVCLKLWDKVLEAVKNGEFEITWDEGEEDMPDIYEGPFYDIDGLKVKILEEMGYPDLMHSCPMCDFYRREGIGTHGCEKCPLVSCMSEGYDDIMSLDGVEAFIRFMKMRFERIRRLNDEKKEIHAEDSIQ